MSHSQLAFGASDWLRFVGMVERAGTPCDSASTRLSGDHSRRPRPTQPPLLPKAGAKTAIKLMQRGVTRSGGISRAEQFTTWKEKSSGSVLKASARRFITLLVARALCDRISGPCQGGSRQQDVVIARPSVAHRIGAFEARGGTERHVTPQVADVKKKKKTCSYPGTGTCSS